jgi:hypothetical protein
MSNEIQTSLTRDNKYLSQPTKYRSVPPLFQKLQLIAPGLADGLV